ncbi:MAG TPA: N-acetylmuramoyl-L-alanine amidase [Kofleriaceae bacterium]|jgi:hypothetical protein|nr:N-acetylmuramoyl-L-alanine amidase [Kofleriaceae bacterium]
MGGIIIANHEFPIEVPIKTWHETGWDATIEACVQSESACPAGGGPFGANAPNPSARRYAFRPQLRQYGKNPPLEAVKALLNQFIFHHDGCLNSAMCWQVLQNERGLSCHFLVDHDGTIYQTCDLAFMAYHAAVFNVPSIGVEMSNRGEAAKDQSYYAKHNMKRDIGTVTINGSKILTFKFTEAQRLAMTALCGALTRLLPNIPLEFPQDPRAPGQQMWDTLLVNGQETGAFGFKGYLGHYHCTRRKWDPGPFDFKDFIEKLRGQRCFPLWTGKDKPKQGERPLVTSNLDDTRATLKILHKRNEEKDDGGFFPIGPWGEHAIWHGGVHIKGSEKDTIWSPFAGRLIAARMGKSSPFGSTNFVLVRHDMTVGDVTMRFFALYMHVFDETKETDPNQSPPWMKKEGWQKVVNRAKLDPKEREKVWDEPGSVALLDEPIEAGEVIARMGKAGPNNSSQIHFEIFSEQQVFEKMADSKFQLVDGSGSGRFADPSIFANVDVKPKDGKFTHDEMTSFFSSGGEAEQYRLIVAYHVSEWTAEPDWAESLKADPELRDVKPNLIEEMVSEQITPTLWWDDKVARHCNLRNDGLVYHYNPIDFIGFINLKIQEAALTAPPPDANNNAPITGPAAGVTDDNEGDDGKHSISDDQATGKDPKDCLKIENMTDGFAGDMDCPT